MKIYTRTGDAGQTGLFGGEVVSKAHPRVAAYGAVDELNAALGWAVAAGGLDADLVAQVEGIQSRLFDLGADLATPPGTPAGAWLHRVPERWVAALEADIDAMDGALPPLRAFILPGGSPASAALHLARTACRRAERGVVAAIEGGVEISPIAVAYLNRLGDWLFTAARLANARAGIADRPWVAEAGGKAP